MNGWPALVRRRRAACSGGRGRGVRSHRSGACCVLFASVLVCLVGCSAEDPRLQALRKQFVLDDEPKQPTTIADAKAKIEENARVELVATVAATEHETFSPEKGYLLVTEVLPGQHQHSGERSADDCPFCRRRAAKAPRAAVRFVDDAGEKLAVDARELFGIKTGDTVVIRGTGELIGDLDLLVVTADGIYLR